MGKPYIENISVTESLVSGKFAVVLDVKYKDKTKFIVDSIDDGWNVAWSRARELGQLWDIGVTLNFITNVKTGMDDLADALLNRIEQHNYANKKDMQ